MYWTIEKLQQRIQELKDWRYRESIDVNEWVFAADKDEAIGAHPPDVIVLERLVSVGDRWSGRGTYYWLSKTVNIPQAWKDQRIVGLFNFGKTGGGTNMGFESLLFLNRNPYQGVDMYHQEVLFSSAIAGTEVELTFRLWAGLEGGGEQKLQEHQFRKASIAIIDPHADNLYYTAKAALDSVTLMPENRLERHELLQAIDRAFLLLNWSYPGSDEFYQSIVEAEALLENELKRLEETNRVTVHCVGHTHIDVAWLWQLKHTREKSARSFSTVLRLMEQYPEYIFMQTQPQLYAYLKEDYPEIYAQIKERVKEGRWEAAGGMWLEADCNLTSGESIVRQLLYGTRFFRDEFNYECDYLWLPDVFGYSWALPQILQKSGIKTFMTTKISWNQYNRMPHDTFKWRGIDGSEVLTHFVTTPDVPGSTVWWYTYNGFTEPFAVKGVWDTYRDKSVNNELLLTYGYGDGGGGVNRDMLETRRRLENMPGIPKAIPGRADDFFRGLHERIDAAEGYVHTWDGELYLEYHRGTYTSQAFVKRMNRKIELLLREAEWLHVLYAVANQDWSHYPKVDLDQSWKTILRNQFHDIIPGSSITEVYDDARIEYTSTEAKMRDVLKDATTLMSKASEHGAANYVIYNSASFVRSDLAIIPLADGEGGVWLDAQGHPLTSQREDNCILVQMKDLSGLSVDTIRMDRTHSLIEAQSTPFQYDEIERIITTPHYKITLNEYGQFTSIYDVTHAREVLASGESGNILQVFEDKPKSFDAWDIDLFYQQKCREIRTLVSLEWKSSGALRATLKLVWKYGKSTINQQIHFYASSRRIDFETNIDWQERQQLLKAAFPVDVRSIEATYDIQFGNVKRPTHWNTSWDYARFESVAHQWADLSERDYGVAILNDCKYGHDIKDHVMRLTLLKSSIYPDTQADLGEHQFTYALLPHGGDWVEGEVQQEAWMLNNPLIVSEGCNRLVNRSLFSISNTQVMIDSVKKAEDSNAVVLRIHENTGARCEVTISSSFDIAAWQECDLMERATGEVQVGVPMVIILKPYEITTILVQFA